MKKCFFAGLVTLLPLAVTLWIVLFFVRFLTKPFIGFVTPLVTAFVPHTSMFSSPQVIWGVSQILILIALFALTFLVGFTARKFFFHSLIRLGDRIMRNIPLVNKIYKTSKEIVLSLLGSKGDSFKQVVLLPFPYPGSYCLGLITSRAPQSCDAASQQKMVSVFIPTTPNPTTGYLTMCEQENLIYLDMKSDEAIKYIVSCGVIQPAYKRTDL